MKKSEIPEFIDKVFAEYPDVKCALDFSSPLELLVASRLSAQCTDVRVNIVCNELFKKYKTVSDFANADREELEKMIFSCGLYRTKARDIIAAAKKLEETGNFPETLEEFCSLPGVGRKIANLVLGDIYNIPGIVADTHCIRINGRIGYYPEALKDPARVEKILSGIIPPEEQTAYCHRMVLFGREYCMARGPRCGECPIKEYCAHFESASNE